MRFPLLRVDAINRVRQSSVAERYGFTGQTPFWNVGMKHIYFGNMDCSFQFETEAEARRFSLGMNYDTREILDLWGRSGLRFDVTQFKLTTVHGEKNAWTGLAQDRQAWQVDLAGNDGSGVKFRYPTETHARATFGKSIGLTPLDLFGTFPGIRLPAPPGVEYPVTPLQPPESPPDPDPIPEVVEKERQQRTAAEEAAAKKKADEEEAARQAALGETWTGREIKQAGYTTTPPNALISVGAIYRNGGYYAGYLSVSKRYLSQAEMQELNLSYVARSIAGWYNGVYFGTDQFARLKPGASGGFTLNNYQSLGDGFGSFSVSASVIFDITDPTVSQSYYVVAGGASGWYYNEHVNLTGDWGYKHYNAGTYNSPRDGWFYGQFFRG